MCSTYVLPGSDNAYPGVCASGTHAREPSTRKRNGAFLDVANFFIYLVLLDIL